jgi:hypothetical protein
MRRFLTLIPVAVIVWCCGCDPESQRAYNQEVLRYIYAECNGPTVVASIIGASAAGGLHGLCTDQSWRMLAGTKIPEFESVPSMFEIADPNRSILITTTHKE